MFESQPHARLQTFLEICETRLLATDRYSFEILGCRCLGRRSQRHIETAACSLACKIYLKVIVRGLTVKFLSSVHGAFP